MEAIATLDAKEGRMSSAEWISQDDLVARWKVSKKTIRRLRQSGKLPAFAITSALYRFRLSDILKIESAGEFAPAIAPLRKKKSKFQSSSK
jgi:Helix-turn-helix domain